MSRLLAALLVLALFAAAPRAQDAAEKARALRKSGQLEQALAVLEAARAGAPRDEQLAGLQGLCLLDAGRTAEAAQLAAAFPGYAGSEPRLHTFLGRAAALDRRWDEALQHLQAALAVDGRMVEPAVESVRTLMAAGRFAAAVTAAARVEALQPELGRRLASEALVAQADRLQSQGQEALGLVVEKLAAALELRPDDLVLGERLLDLQVPLLRVDDARALAARLYPGEAGRGARLYWEGRCRDALTDKAGARESFEQALAAQPEHAGARLELARLDIEEGAFERALERLAPLPEGGQHAARRLLLTGLAEMGLHRDGPAEEHLRAALALEPANLKTRYQLGRLLLRTGRADEGQALLKQVEEQDAP
jgi:thioredoxin-like negative regulator of GroEL